MNDRTQLSIYQIRAVLKGVSPLVWHRLLLSGETSLGDLHKILQLAFGWSSFYSYQFCIYGVLLPCAKVANGPHGAPPFQTLHL
jgi:hypothetical protein